MSHVSQYETVVEDCTAALELDPSYVKALLRRAQAKEHLEKYDLALEGNAALVLSFWYFLNYWLPFVGRIYSSPRFYQRAKLFPPCRKCSTPRYE